MKKLLLMNILILMMFTLFGTNYTGQTINSGEWTDANNWDQTTSPNPRTDQCNLTINHNIDYHPSINPWTNPWQWSTNINITIKSGSILTIYADLDISNNFNLTIEPGGQLIIYGNVTMKNNIIGVIDGDIYISGDLTIQGNGLGDTIYGTGEIVVGGDINDPNGIVDPVLILGLDRWLIVDDGDWNDNNSWSKTSGGPSNTSKPNSQCIVHIENNYNVDVYTTETISGLDIISGSLNILPNSTLTVTDTIINNDSLIINSDATGTAGLIYNKSNKIFATTERYVTANKYSYVSSNMENAPLSSYNVTSGGYSNPNFYYYDETETNPDWLYGWKNPTQLNAGQGYALYTDENNSHSLTDTLININYNVNITNTSQSWNLIGNPFPCNIITDDFITENVGTVFTGAIYFWDDDGSMGVDYNSNDYLVYTLGGGTSGGNGSTHNGIISPLQGFFVQADLGGDLLFSTDIKTTTNGIFIKSLSTMKTISLSLTNSENTYNNILIKVNENASENLDIFDGLKLKGNQYLSFYSILENNPYAIQGLPNLKSVDLGFNSEVSGEHTISIDYFKNYDGELYLEDKYLNIIINLREENYKFDDFGEVNDRFTLHFEKSSRIEIDKIDETVNFYVSNNILFINSDKNEIEMYDLMGRIIFKAQNRDQVQLNYKKGIYLLKVNNVSKKVYID